MIYSAVQSLFGSSPKWEDYTEATPQYSSTFGPAVMESDAPDTFGRERKHSKARSAIVAVADLAAVVPFAPNPGASYTEQLPVLADSTPRTRPNCRWLNVLHEDEPSQPHEDELFHETDEIPSFPQYYLGSPATVDTPISVTEDYDFRDADRRSSPSPSPSSLPSTPDFPSRAETLFCESPLPLTMRANTYASFASGSQHQDSLGGILNEIERFNKSHIPNGMPMPYRGSPLGTPHDEQSLYDQQSYRSEVSAYPYSFPQARPYSE